jgi:CBS domain-containing protein
MLAAEPVSHFMTHAVLSIDVRSPAGEVLRYFAEYPVHHLPVVDGSRVVGMLSSADVMKLEMFLPKAGSSTDYLNQRIAIERIMRRPAITIGADQSLESAARLMAEHGFHALPVTDRDDHLVGIVTTTDVMDAVLHPGHGVPPLSAEPEHWRDLTDEQLQTALRLAARVSSASNDAGRLARALLHVQDRIGSLENVLGCAKRYLNAGQDSRLHTELLAAIEKAR